jgi:hypothetical protein
MEIKKIRIKNFRNLQDFSYDFKPFTEFVRNNAWGKSNIADAIAWIFTGHLYDATSDIESIKPKHNLKALVEIELILDNGLSLRKTYRENWNKSRGTSDYELKGHTTTYYLNGLEMSQTAYEEQILTIVGVDKETFHLLIDPTYFGLKLEWKQRRTIINDIVGEITFSQIIGADPIFKANSGLTTKLEAALNSFNNKIDLTKKSFIQNLNRLKKEEKELEAQIVGLNLIQTPISKEEYLQLYNKIQEWNTEALRLKEGNLNIIPQLETDLEHFRKRYKEIESEQFIHSEPTKDNCPQCGFQLNQSNYEAKLNNYKDLKNKFSSSKAARLSDLNAKGLNLKQQIEVLKGKASGTTEGYTVRIKELEEMIQGKEQLKTEYLSWSVAQNKIKEVQVKLETVVKEINTYEQLSDLLGFYVTTMLKELDKRLKTVFGDINFRLVEPNIKEGSWNEVCEVLDGEVPYHRTNTANQIKIGVKLIEAIRKQKSYPNIPIIIDNAEAVVNRQFNTTNQIICLIAGKENSNE